MHENFGPEGLLKAAQPGWHSKTQPVYPELLTFIFSEDRRIKKLWLLPQDSAFDRAPREFVIEASIDGKNWKSGQPIETACVGPNDTWRFYKLEQEISAKYLRIKILTNCGNIQTTLRGVRFE